MSEGLPPERNPDPVVAPQLSAGTMLRNLRESAGVDLALVASTIKVAPQKLQALEEDRLDQLPGITFARGLAASVCRAFGVDPQPVLDAMPSRAVGLHAVARPPLETTFRRPGDAPAPLLSSKASRAVLGVVVMLLVAAAALWFWPTLPIHLGAVDEPTVAGAADGSISVPLESGLVERGDVVDATPPADPANAPADAADPLPAEPAEPARAAVASGGGAKPDVPPSTPTEPAAANPAGGASASAANNAAAEGAAGQATGTAPDAGAAASGAPTDALALEAIGDSWIGVRDAAGQTLLNRTLTAGEKVSLNGELPLSVVIGRKNAVRVRVHGEPFDDTTQSSSTVSRFQVK